MPHHRADHVIALARPTAAARTGCGIVSADAWPNWKDQPSSAMLFAYCRRDREARFLVP
jgi:hypothetical protein